MAYRYETLGEEGLRFFGKVTASIAHEIKNVLAIINENSGLIEDQLFAASKGRPIDPERLTRVCQQFQKQIGRADQITKNLSRFAHSVDQFQGEIELTEMAQLVTSLAIRTASAKRLNLKVSGTTSPLMVKGNPYLLQNLLWVCLLAVFAACENGSELTISAQAGGESGTTLMLTANPAMNIEQAAENLAGQQDLFSAANAKLVPDLHNNSLVIELK